MRARLPARERGLALVAVLWLVASLTIVVMSISQAVRQEVRAVSSARDALTGQAVGHAAIVLALQDLAARNDKPQRLTTLAVRYREVPVEVTVQPLSGLVDINNAPAALLAVLFERAGGAERDRAQALAAAAVQVRSARDHRGREIGFEAPEDLLRVPGFDYPLYARLAHLVTADLKGSGRVNPLAATAQVLGVLAGGDFDKGAALAAARDAGRAGVDTTGLEAAFVETVGNTSRYHLQARVPLAGGSWLLVSRSVDFAATPRGVPWKVLHSDHRFEPTGH